VRHTIEAQVGEQCILPWIVRRPSIEGVNLKITVEPVHERIPAAPEEHEVHQPASLKEEREVKIAVTNAHAEAIDQCRGGGVPNRHEIFNSEHSVTDKIPVLEHTRTHAAEGVGGDRGEEDARLRIEKIFVREQTVTDQAE